jgi:uncharacterized Tic20 family protein
MEKPTSDEKVLAALAHASIIFAIFGPIGPALIWVNQRNKSKYVRYHALQAMGYQVFSFWAYLIGVLLIMFGVIGLTMIFAFMSSDSSNPPIFPFLMQPFIVLGIFGLFGIFFLYGFAGAVFCMMGNDFSYLFIGNWLKKKLFNEQVTDAEFEEWEDNWVSGVCHATAVLRFLGLITPLIIWVSQKERSMKIRFHSLQAIFYQGIAIAVGFISYIVLTGVYLLFFAGIFIMGSSAGDAPKAADSSPIIVIIFFVFIAVFMLFWLASVIIVPVYYLLSAFAGISTMRGRDFRYPILGGVIAKRLGALNKQEVIQS